MDDDLSRKKMEDQVGLLRNSSLLEEYGWEVEVEGLNVLVLMGSPKGNGAYTLKVNFEDYPQQAPSYLFEGDWPQASKIREDKGICIEGTRECYTEFNHDDRFDDFDPEFHTLPEVLQRIYHLMRK